MSEKDSKNQPMSLVGVIEHVQAQEYGDHLEVDEVLAAFGPRSYGPLLLIPALISVLPGIGALPGISWGAATLIVLISVQFVFHRDKLWVPGFLRNASIPRDKLDKTVNWARPWFARVDKLFEPRLEMLLRPSTSWLVALVCLGMGLAMFPFSLIPGAIIIPGLAVVLLSLGLTSHDGFVLLLGLTAAATSLGVLVWIFVF